MGPIAASRNKEHWPWRHHCGDFNVVRIKSQPWRVFADVPSLHLRGNHVDDSRVANTLIDGSQQKGLGTTTRSPSHGDSLRIDAWEALQKIQCANGVP